MNGIFDVTGEDIAKLGDSSLRELIGLLCEADYRKANLPVKKISWGGNQDAQDGGLDVVVEDDVTPPVNSFVPLAKTGFQVKKPKMTPSAISKEMLAKNGTLKADLRNFLSNNSAYIIVSSGDSLAQKSKAHSSRINVMKAALSTAPELESVQVDFYDQGKIATWVRQYPGINS